MKKQTTQKLLADLQLYQAVSGEKDMTVTVDKYTRSLLTVIAVLLSLVVVGLWHETPGTIPVAQASGIPNQGQQLNEVVIELQQVNTSLEMIADLLVSGKVKVRLLDDDGKPVTADTVLTATPPAEQ